MNTKTTRRVRSHEPVGYGTCAICGHAGSDCDGLEDRAAYKTRMAAEADKGHVYFVEGSHPWVPGIRRTAHATRAGANKRAAELMNMILADLQDVHGDAYKLRVTENNWEKGNRKLWRDRDDAGVSVDRMKVEA